MPTYHKDFLTNCADTFIRLFKSDALLKNYNWEDWDSDKEVQTPRGYFQNMKADQDVERSPLFLLRPEIVLQGKPKRAKFSAAMYQLEQILLRDDLHHLLNTQAEVISDPPLVMFYNCAEGVTFIQRIAGDTRERSVTFAIAAGPYQ